MGKTGKKAAITKDIIDTFTGAIGDGLSVTGAAGLAGVARSTIRHWLDRGRRVEEGDVKSSNKQDKLMVELVLGTRAAAAKIEHELVTVIRGAARGAMRGDWRAASFILERRYQKDWCRLVQDARREAVDIMLEELRLVLSAEEYETIRRRLASAALEG